MSRPRVTQPALDRSVPGVIFTIGDHTWDYGALATIRTLGRVGVPTYAMVPTLDLPAVSSKYLTEAVLTPTTGEEPEDALVAAMRRTCDVIGRPAVGIAGDDETAVLLARRAASFEGQLLLPQVPPELPARLASKSGLAELCAEAGAPTPRSTTPADWAQLDAFEASATYPLVLKNPEPFSRLVSPGVDRTTRVADRSELEQALSAWQPGNALLVQEFIPEDASEDWYVEALFNDASEPVVVFTGRKLRAYPVSTGIGTLSESVANPDLAELATDFARTIGYAGLADMDWRLDHRDGQYKLLDFNPRRGAQFRLFQSTAGIDVVRALHLELTGRPMPSGRQIDGIRHVVGLQDQRAYAAGRKSGTEGPPPFQRGRVERAWWAADDPRPALHFSRGLAAKATGRVRRA
ncbi:MAG: ATP-grasp domain-containing protein [Candidatus Nanopelagicales bacterium]